MVADFHNHLVRGSRRAVFAAIGLGMVTSASAEITGKNTAEFETVISVQSTSDVCKLMVTPPADNKFAVSYRFGAIAGGDYGLTLTSPNKEPRYVMVTAVGGASCGVGGVTTKIELAGGHGSWRELWSPPNSSGGIWKVVADTVDARLYTDTNATPSMPSETRVALYGPYFKPTASWPAMDGDNGYRVGGLQAVSLTKSYRVVGYPGEPSIVNKLTIEDKNKVYKRLAIGFGAFIAPVPFNVKGEPSPELVSDGDVTSIPYVVTIGTL